MFCFSKLFSGIKKNLHFKRKYLICNALLSFLFKTWTSKIKNKFNCFIKKLVFSERLYICKKVYWHEQEWFLICAKISLGTERNWVFATNSNFLISISLQHKVWYFELKLFDLFSSTILCCKNSGIIKSEIKFEKIVCLVKDYNFLNSLFLKFVCSVKKNDSFSSSFERF